MDVVGSEIGQKMRSAIKAKLTELGCYVDDELPDYVMVMVANKRTRAQMEEDLQLFLGDNTELFVNWLHQVLKKLQEVTVTAPLKTDLAKSKEKSVKENKSKDKKEKSKKHDSSKKSKKKDKEKARKKEEKKSHKKKKSKHHEMIRPNIPPLLMNMEKEPEPSITDVFAGQILKNHGVMLEPYKENPKIPEVKPVVNEVKRPMVPIIDPASIPSQSEIIDSQNENTENKTNNNTKQDQMKEMNQIEAKIQGLKQKLAEQLDSMSDDEDFLNIRTEAEELMNDFAEDVFQEISQPPPITPPLKTASVPTPSVSLNVPKEPQMEPETLPQIELNLPKRPIRERLGARDVATVAEKEKEPVKIIESPERLTPEREPETRPQIKPARSRLGSQSESQRRVSVSEENSDKSEATKRLTSKVSSIMENRPRGSCASVVRVRPRPRVSTTSSLLLRAVADAHKSLLNIPPKVDTEPSKIKRALVLPMRRCVDPQKIVIQVPVDTQADSQGDSISLGDPESDLEEKSSKATNDDKEEYTPRAITKVISNTEYVPSRTASQDDTPIIDNITIHNTTVDKNKDTQFIVTMDGYHPNAFLAKKLMTEGILDEEIKEPKETNEAKKQIPKESVEKKETASVPPQKRLSDTSEESETQVIIKQEKIERRESIDDENNTELKVKEGPESPPAKKRKGSPIVFDVKKDVKEEPRQRTTSGSDTQVIVTTVSSTHKYDSLPPLSQAERKPPVWCRAFPLCRFGAACAFAHPRCKFAAACTRRGCVYSHAHTQPPAAPATPVPPAVAKIVASHVVPAANYKTITPVASPSLCKFYPNCVNPACHYYHPKPCRYGKACVNKLECNFYHNDLPTKWKYSN